ncbi:MAG: tetratricopeptide repeat protein, partial [Mariprofundaceae bacterium]
RAASLQHRASREDSKPVASAQLARILWSQGERDAASAMLAVLMLRNPEDEQLLALKQAWAENGES